MFSRIRRASYCAFAVAAAALLSSCSGSAGSPGDSGTISISVGALPVVDDVSLYIAANDGIFKKFGLDVKVVPVQQSTKAIPLMQSGKLDIVGGGNYVSFIQLAAKDPANPPFKILTEAATCATGAFNVLALPDSGINTPKDLEGKTIAVNLTNNIQTLMIDEDLRADNVDAAKVHYVVVPFPQMSTALKSHKVDAIGVVEPFVTLAEQTVGAGSVLDLCSGPTTALPLSGYLATSTWAGQHPEAVHRFREAISEAQEIADTNRVEVEKTLVKYVPKLTSEQAATISLAQFPTSADAVQLNRVSDLMREAGLINKSLTASALIQK